MATSPNVIVKMYPYDERKYLCVGTLKDGKKNTSDVEIYSSTTGIDLSAYDFYPNHNMVGLILTAGTGAIPLILLNGGEIIITHTVAAASIEVFMKGVLIQQILKTGYTFNGYVFPLF